MIAGARERRADGKERKLSSKASVAMEQTRLTVSSGDGKRVLYVAPLLRAEVTHFARKPHQFGVRLANGDSLLISVPRGPTSMVGGGVSSETTATVATWMRGIMSLATRLDASFTSRAIDSARILAPSLGGRQVQLLLNAVIGRVGDSAALRDVLLGAHVARFESSGGGGGANNNASNDAAARMLAVQQHVCTQFFAAVKDPSAPAPAAPRLDRAFVELSQRRVPLGQFAEATLTVHNDGQCGVFVEALPIRALPNGVALTVEPANVVVPPRASGTLRCRVRFDCSRVLRVLQQLRLTSDNGGYQCSLFVPIVGESEPSLDLAFDDVEFGDQIGSGQFGTVFKGLLRGGGRSSALPVAVKVIGYPDDFEQERAVMRSLPPHDNIVEFFGSATRRPFQGFLVFAYYPLGSLDRLIYADELAAPLALTVAREIIDALRFLHAKHVLHLDLKPQNVLVCSTDLAARVHIKLCDFGIARAVDSMRTFVGAQVEGTLLYMAPEMLDKVYSPKVDVYSFGVCLWEMLVRKLPFSEAPFTEMTRFQFDVAKAGGALPGPMPAAVSARVRVLLERCLSSDRELRPSSDTLGELLAVLAPDDFQPMPLAAEQRAASLARKESRMPKVVNRFARASQILLVSSEDHGGAGGGGGGGSNASGSNADEAEDDGSTLSDAQLRTRFHRQIARTDAETLLRGKPAGTFLLRSRGREPLALSYIDGDGTTVRHAGIVEHKDGGYSLDSQPPSARQPRLVLALQSLGAKLKFSSDDLLHIDFAILDAQRADDDDDDDGDEE